MKKLILFVLFSFMISYAFTQPCKKVKVGMTPPEVLNQVGEPVEVDSLGSDLIGNGQKESIVVWQYGEVGRDNNQRVHFTGGKVSGIISNGKKHDELLMAFRRGEIKAAELDDRINKLNQAECK